MDNTPTQLPLDAYFSPQELAQARFLRFRLDLLEQERRPLLVALHKLRNLAHMRRHREKEKA